MIILSSQVIFSNEIYTDFCKQSNTVTSSGMLVLGSWALANMSTGAYGWANNKGENKYFNQMNFFWNTVNLAISGYALYSNSYIDCTSLSDSVILNNHVDTENLLLINSVLDVAYIGSGFLLKYLSDKYPDRADLLKGYGNSIILQGSFLLIFDLALYGILNDLRSDFSDKIQIAFDYSKMGLNLCIKF